MTARPTRRTLTVESFDPLARRRESADQHSWYTAPTWPRSVATNLPSTGGARSVAVTLGGAWRGRRGRDARGRLACSRGPQANRAVERSRREPVAIGGEGGGIHELHVAGEARDRLLRARRRPEVQREVVGSAREELGRATRGGVAFGRCGDRGVGVGGPRAPVVIRAGAVRGVGRQGEAIDPVRVPIERSDQLRVVDRPHLRHVCHVVGAAVSGRRRHVPRGRCGAP